MTEEKKMLFSQDALKKLLWPLIIEQFLAIAMGMADTVMAASCGEAVVSGISLVDSICVLLIGLFTAMASGGAVVAAQYMGHKKPLGNLPILFTSSSAVVPPCRGTRSLILL